jgi:GABA(A) receptor-associated protein
MFQDSSDPLVPPLIISRGPEQMEFKKKHTFETRAAEATRIREKFPGRVPVIIERAAKDKMLAPIDKNKFLVPADLTMGQFIFVIRKRISLSSESALFVFCNNSLPTTGSLMRELYGSHGDHDGFLYMTYCGENTFGS